jgi:adenine-specific DNA-methyltransferase
VKISLNDPKVKRLRKLSGELFQMTQQQQLFEMSKREKAAWNKRVAKLTQDTKKLEAEIEEIKANKIFENAFEWRFEFPEVLNDDGDFVGFDAIIGNPPYIRVQHLDHNLIDYYKSNYSSFFQKADIYLLFIEKALTILNQNRSLSFINPTLFMSSDYGQGLREYLTNYQVSRVVDFGDLPVFEEAITYTGIFFIKKSFT